jgi:hypothetical protein
VTQDIVDRLRWRARVHAELEEKGEKAESWPDLFSAAADTIDNLRVEVASITARYEALLLVVIPTIEARAERAEDALSNILAILDVDADKVTTQEGYKNDV